MSLPSKIKFVAGMILVIGTVVSQAQTFTPFTWPASNAGPYTVASVLSNATVFMPNADVSTENDMASHKYSHHTRIWWSGGTTWLAFSSGCTNESDSGVQTAMCWSSDRGATWSSPPIQVVPSMSRWSNGYAFDYSTRVAYPRNWTSLGGTNYLIVAVDSFDPAGKLRGDALLARAVFQNGSLGTLFRISTNACTELDGKTVPAYGETNLCVALMNDSKIYGCWGGSRAGVLPDTEWRGWLILYSPKTVEMAEPNTFSADGTTNNLYRIWRGISSYSPECSLCPLFVWQQMSTNGGSTWSTQEEQTSIPNGPSETVGRRLSDGRFVIIGNPNMYVQDQVDTNGIGARDPLFMAISEPNSTTITNVMSIRQGITHNPVYAGASKSGGAQYPDAIQVGNYMYISYSIHKESVGFSRVLIPGLQDNNNDGSPGTVASISAGRVGTLRMGQ